MRFILFALLMLLHSIMFAQLTPNGFGNRLGYGIPGSTVSRVQLGYDKLRNGNYEGAIKKFSKILADRPENEGAIYGIAYAHYMLHNYKEAVSFCDSFIHMDKSRQNIEEEYLGNAYLLKASCYNTLGNKVDAINTYEKSVARFPRSAILHYYLAYDYFSARQYDTAMAIAYKAVYLNPSQPQYHILLARCLMARGSWCYTLPQFCHALLLAQPGSQSALYALAMVDSIYQRIGDSTILLQLQNKPEDSLNYQQKMIQALHGVRMKAIQEHKTKQKIFAILTKRFCALLGDTTLPAFSPFWKATYHDFFYNIYQEGYAKTFAYYISRSRNTDDVNDWISENKTKVKEFKAWLKKED